MHPFVMPPADQAVVGEIAAIVKRDGPAHAADVERLVAGYAGGPTHVWGEGHVAIAHTGSARLRVFPDVAVAFDGRIDNLDELARRIALPRTAPAVDVLAACWRKAGPDMLDWVVGELAAVIADRRSGDVHALRDLCAARPLHVARDGRDYLAASEWHPLAVALGTEREPNPEWFAAAFTGHAIDATAVPSPGVDMVLPGHVARPGGARWVQQRHADWHVPTLRDHRPGVYADEFRELFDQAVRCRVAGHTEAGVSLSGGLDSTSVMVTLATVRPEIDRAALCVPMREPAGDERRLQSLVAGRAGSALHWVDYETSGLFGAEGPFKLFERLGAPPLVINWFLGDAIADEALGAGLRVVLDGEDGDGSVGGSPAFLPDLIATGRWRSWLRDVNAYRATGQWCGKELARLSLFGLAPPAARRAHIRQQGPMSPPVLAKSLGANIDLERRLQDSYLVRSWSLGRFFRRAQGEVGKPEQMAPVFTAISDPWRRRGICLSHPWSDRRLMSFCMGLPYEHVLDPGRRTKVVLRQAMADRLPPEVRERRGKADISEAARRAAFGRDRDRIRRGLELARTQSGWFDAQTVSSIAATFEGGTGEAEAARVAMFAWWLDWCERGATSADDRAGLAEVA